MRRKLVQMGESTLMLSIPREWIVSHNLSKGDELEIEIDEDKLSVWPNTKLKKEKVSLDVSDFKETLPRLLYSLYRSGIDELELKSKDEHLVDKVKSVIWKEAVGFELIEQKPDSCRIVNVSGKLEDFNNMLRRLFLVTITMSEECAASIKKNDGIENVLYLEQENNRLANVLIRAINKYGSHGFKKIGPLYYIIQELERIGDQYKYFAQYLISKGKWKIKNDAILESASKILRLTYELFYRFEAGKIEEIRKARNELVAEVSKKRQNIFEEEKEAMHCALNVASRSFDMVSSIFILRI